MKKKTIMFGSVILVSIIASIILLALLGAEHGTVYVEGQFTKDILVSQHKCGNGTTLRIPLLAVLNHLEYEITPQNENIIELKKNDKVFILDLEQLSLLGGEHKGMNYLTCPPGSVCYYCQRKEDDIILDMNTLDVVLWLMEGDHYVGGIPALKLVFVNKPNPNSLRNRIIEAIDTLLFRD